MANKSKKNKDYQARKNRGNKPANIFKKPDGNEPPSAFNVNLDLNKDKFKNMKLLTIAVVIAMVFFVAARMWASHQATKYDVSVQPYLTDAIPAISSWNKDKIKSLIVPEVLNNIPESDFETMLASYRKLGDFRSMQTPEFEAVNSMTTDAGDKFMLVTYKTEVSYRNGPAELSLVLKQTPDGYQIYHLNIDAKVLSE